MNDPNADLIRAQLSQEPQDGLGEALREETEQLEKKRKRLLQRLKRRLVPFARPPLQLGRVIPRSESGLAAPRRPIASISKTGTVFKHHTVTVPAQHPSESAHLRWIQQIAFDRDFNDISYSFVIFNSGNVFEARGPLKLGAHTEGYNVSAHGIAFAMNSDQVELTPQAIDSYRWLIWHGGQRGWWVVDPRQREHDDVKATACPGGSVKANRAALSLPYLPEGDSMAWEQLEGKLKSAPAVAPQSENRIDVFVRGTDDACWHTYWNGSFWVPWESLGGVLTDAPGAGWAGSQLHVFVCGEEDGEGHGTFWHTYWDGSAWKP
jgi:hypothetical protein